MVLTESDLREGHGSAQRILLYPLFVKTAAITPTPHHSRYIVLLFSVIVLGSLYTKSNIALRKKKKKQTNKPEKDIFPFKARTFWLILSHNC